MSHRPKEVLDKRKEFGVLLKNYREACGISVAAISQVTRISVNFITEIEAGDFNNLPGEVFTRGFVKNIALALKVDPKELLSILDNCYSRDESRPTRDYGRVLRSDPHFFQLTKNHFKAALIGIFGVVVFLRIIGIDGQEDKALNTVPLSDKKTSLGQGTEKLGLRGKQVPIKVVKPESSSQSRQILKLSVKQPVKIKMDIDAKQETVDLNPGQYTYAFLETAELLIYDAALLTVEFNGKPLGSLGKSGRVRRLSFRDREPEMAPSEKDNDKITF